MARLSIRYAAHVWFWTHTCSVAFCLLSSGANLENTVVVTELVVNFTPPTDSGCRYNASQSGILYRTNQLIVPMVEQLFLWLYCATQAASFLHGVRKQSSCISPNLVDKNIFRISSSADAFL